MAGITLAYAKERLEAWLQADLAVSQGQEYTLDTDGVKRSLTRVDAAEIRNQIDYWNRWVVRLERGSGGPRVRYVVPRD